MTADTEQLLQATEQHVRQLLQHHDASHDFTHIGMLSMSCTPVEAR